MRRDFDVCIIGTGAGGGVMLDELTRAGFDVVALQRGPNLPPRASQTTSSRSSCATSSSRPDLLESYRLDANERAVPGRYNTVAHAVGGTMTRWSGWSWRFRGDDFRVLCERGRGGRERRSPDWPVSYAELEPFYARAEREFGVSGLAGANPFTPPRSGPYPNPPHPPRLSSLVFERGAKRAGLHPFPVPIAINPQPYNGRAGCTWGGACQGFGCMIHAEGNFVVCLHSARARQRTARSARAGARVRAAAGPDGRVRGARYLDGQGHEQEVRARPRRRGVTARWARRTCCCSRAPGSFQMDLPASSGARRPAPDLPPPRRRHASVMDEPALGVAGIEVYRAIDDWHASDPKRGFIRAAAWWPRSTPSRGSRSAYALTGAGDPGLARGWGAPLKRYLREFPRAITIGSILEDLPMAENRVDLDPDVKDAQGLPVARITHRQHRERHRDERLVRAADRGLAQACKPASSWRILLPGLHADRREDGDARGARNAHGTCRMGADPAEVGARPLLPRARRSESLGGRRGLLPTAGGYNPTAHAARERLPRRGNIFVAEAKRQERC